MVRHFEMSRNSRLGTSLCAYDVIKKRKWRRSMRSLLKPKDTQYYISGLGGNFRSFILLCSWICLKMPSYNILFHLITIKGRLRLETTNGTFYISCNVVSRDDSLRKEFLFFCKIIGIPKHSRTCFIKNRQAISFNSSIKAVS